MIASLTGLFAIVVASTAVPAWRRHQRMQTCLEGVVPAYVTGGAGAGAERLATAVCEELTADENHAARSGGALGDARTNRREALVRVHASVIGELLVVRRAVVETSPEACTAMWMGSDGTAEMAALAHLSDDELRRHARTVAALAASARRRGEPVTTVEAAVDRFDGFLEDLVVDGDGEAFVVSEEAPDDPALACAAHRALLTAIEALPPVERGELARAWFVTEVADFEE